MGELKPRYKPTNVNAFNTIVYKTSINKTINTEHCDQESYPIAIDSCCSVSIVKNKEDFNGKLHKFKVTIQGFNMSAKIKFKGTWKIRIEDQQGTIHYVMIPNTLLSPEAPYHLLSPQDWGQQSKDPERTYCIIKHNKMILYWEVGIIKANYPGQ